MGWQIAPDPYLIHKDSFVGYLTDMAAVHNCKESSFAGKKKRQRWLNPVLVALVVRTAYLYGNDVFQNLNVVMTERENWEEARLGDLAIELRAC